MKSQERRKVARKARMAIKWLKNHGYSGFVLERLALYHLRLK